MSVAAKIFVASIPILISMYVERYREQDLSKSFPNSPHDLNLPVAEKFDFIVVGGGTGGCVVSRRLSDANFSVLLLEAGGNPPPLQAIQLASYYTYTNKDITFLYQSIRQKNVALASQGIVYTEVGKMLGGGSSHHDQLYERGHPLDYDNWANLTDDKNWKYKNILKYFKMAEKYLGKYKSTKGQHGFEGPMTITRPSNVPGRELWLKAGKEMGYKILDSNGPQRIGFSHKEYNQEFGRRVSTYTAYIKPVEEIRENFVVRRYAVVSKILIDSSKKATGVLYTHHGIPRVASAKKEIILSAGAFMSPILLIKSGIGPLDQLREGKVKPISILPVGKNLMNHATVKVSPLILEDKRGVYYVESNLTFDDFSTFIRKGEGPLVHCYFSGGEAFLGSSRARTVEKKPEWPDLQVQFGLFQNRVDDPLDVCILYVGRPYSRGRLTVNFSSTDMEDNFLPIIDYNFFDDDADFHVAIEGIKFCLDMIERAPSFKKIGARLSSLPVEQCKNIPFRSYNYWKCYIRNYASSAHHTAGTCRMGKRGDESTVVDSKFRVVGVKKLRVVDASIMPAVTNANLVAPIVMIGEKAAQDIIRQQARRDRGARRANAPGRTR